MKRLFLASFAILGVATVAFADPVKKVAAIDSDKLTKECGEAFIKALMDSKVDEALKLCATPFLDQNGKVSDTLDEVAREFKNGPPAGIEIKVGETIALEKFNEWAKKKGGKELDRASDSRRRFDSTIHTTMPISRQAIRVSRRPCGAC